jgi:predicted alternative tryptophan synthase beta-subunit
MKLDFNEKGKLKLDMVDYVYNMIKEFPEELSQSKHPWNKNLFKVDLISRLLPKEKKELFIQACLT